MGTFNVQSQLPSGSLKDWWSEGSLLESGPDILVFGMQEVDRSAEALLYSTSTLKEELWVQAINNGLGPVVSSQYEKVRGSLIQCIAREHRFLTIPYS